MKSVKGHFRALFIFAVAATCGACSVNKYIPEGESLYKKVTIDIIPNARVPGQKRVRTELENRLAPKPDKSFLGTRPGVWLYYSTGADHKTKGIGKKLGRPAVLLSDLSPENSAKMMEGYLNNTGYFRSHVTSEVITKNKKSEIKYTVLLNPPFRLIKINRRVVDSLKLPDVAKGIYEESLLRPRQRFNLERLKAEQVRIEGVMENHGYYYFDDQHLIFEADSTVGKRKVELDLLLEKDVPARALRVYKVKNINIIPNYDLNNDSLSTTADTIRVDGFNYIDNQHNFRPEIITNVINLRPDSTYRRINHEYTLSHLMGLRTFKFVNIKYSEDPHDSSALNASIYLTPLLRKSLRIQLQAVSKSNNFVGPGLEFTFTNRNFLRGAELFQLKFHSAYEVQISRQQSGALNSLESGAESSLSIPRFITPIYIPYRSAKYVPQTQFRIGYNLQQRLDYFSLASFNTAFGYLWRETTVRTHELYPIDISLVRAGKTSVAFEDLLKASPALANSFQNQFIIGSRYSFTLNTQIKEDIEAKYDPTEISKSNFYLNGNVDLSGNILNALQRIGGEKESGLIMGVPYSQYFKVDADFRYYYDISKKSKLVTRLYAGVGYAYGNSTNLPYIKQYSSGGSNSIRAFPARSIGPGIYNVRLDSAVRTATYFIDQRGDIKLEGNVEYRFDIIKVLKGAVFVDAGNIWLRKEDPQRPGSQFKKSSAVDELAVGAGFGLRVDFSFFVLRFDTAFPLRRPWLAEGQRWVLEDFQPRDKDWRRDNLILNIAIGYPF